MRAFPSCAMWIAAVSATAVGCLYDSDERCGPHQEYEDGRCVCASGYGLSGNVCVACGVNEVGSLSGCSCAPGYVRASADAPCEEQGGLGLACQRDADCEHPVFSYCHLSNGTGYCTRPNCASSADCETSIDYACNDRASPSFCERPPSGLGAPCTNSSMCAAYEASYCEALQEKVCLPNGCKENPSKCHGDWVCCDIGLLSQSLCIPPTELTNGTCPVGGTLIPRSR